MELKIKKEELEYVPDGSMDNILDKIQYLLHYPELAGLQGKGLLFHIIRLKDGSIYYVGGFGRESPEISPKYTKQYSGKSKNIKYVTSITLKYNRMYHLVGKVFVFV